VSGTTAARTMAYLRKRGWVAWKVERWVSYIAKDKTTGKRLLKGGNRIDLYGLWDVMAMCGTFEQLGVQTCVDGDRAAHRHTLSIATVEVLIDGVKVQRPALPLWLATGCRGLLVSWGKHGKAHKRKLWVPHWEQAHLVDGRIEWREIEAP